MTIELDEQRKPPGALTVGQARRSAARIAKESDVLAQQGCHAAVLILLRGVSEALDEYADQRECIEKQLLRNGN